jgi:hypothetical protein
MTLTDRFPRPDWQSLWADLEALPNDEAREHAWLAHGHRWLTETAEVLGGDFHVADVSGFWIVSNRPARQLERIGKLLQGARRRILGDLDGVARDPLFSQLAVLWLEDETQYYEYVSHYYPDAGEFSFSGGMFLRAGYPHFVFPHYEEFSELEHVMSHELTHALVSHLPLPLWLNEGMAVTMEEAIAGRVHARTIPERLDEYPDFWNAGTIQEFWNGESFSRPDEGNALSYALAQLLTVNLAHDFDAFRAFALAASWEDGGEAAARDTLGISLGDLVSSVFGKGDWTPQPGRWSAHVGDPNTAEGEY